MLPEEEARREGISQGRTPHFWMDVGLEQPQTHPILGLPLAW